MYSSRRLLTSLERRLECGCTRTGGLAPEASFLYWGCSRSYVPLGGTRKLVEDEGLLSICCFSFLFCTDNDQSAWNWNWCTSVGGERGIAFSTRFDDNIFLTTMFRGSSQKYDWCNAHGNLMTQGMLIFKFSSWAFMMIMNNKKKENEITIGKCLGFPVQTSYGPDAY